GDFLALGGVILCGHPDRNVARVELGGEGFFLKREHRVRRRDRLAAAWAGFGLASKSYREFLVLRAATAAGIGCPQPLAVGGEGGRAFLLLRELDGARDLRVVLGDASLTARQRRWLAERLGRELA